MQSVLGQYPKFPEMDLVREGDRIAITISRSYTVTVQDVILYSYFENSWHKTSCEGLEAQLPEGTEGFYIEINFEVEGKSLQVTSAYYT